MNSDTYIFTKQLKETGVTFIVGDSPTVTFNDNVTVYIYPKVNNIENELVNNTGYIESNTIESNTIESNTIETKNVNNLFRKIMKNITESLNLKM